MLHFQSSILRYILHEPQGEKYLALLNETIFTQMEYRYAYEAIKVYYDKYSKLPKQGTLRHIVDEAFQQKGMSGNTFKSIVDEIVTEIYEPLDVEYIQDYIIESAQLYRTKELMKSYALELTNVNKVIDDKFYLALQSKITEVTSLKDTMKSILVEEPDYFLLKDWDKYRQKEPQVIKTKFEKLNNFMTWKGFKAPEVIVIAAGHKAGKTTLLVNLAVGFLREDLKILYVDTENGVNRLHPMMYQCMLECTKEELYGRSYSFTEVSYEEIAEEMQIQRQRADEKLGTAAKAYQKYTKSEIKVEFFAPKRYNVNDVMTRIEKLKEEHNFVPDVILCDYFDNMKSCKAQPVRHLELQEIYMDWKVLAAKYNVPVFTVSQLNRSGIGKETFGDSAIAGDIGKFANADTIIGYALAEEDEAITINRLKGNKDFPLEGRLFIMANRDGINGGVVDIVIDREKCLITQKD